MFYKTFPSIINKGATSCFDRFLPSGKTLAYTVGGGLYHSLSPTLNGESGGEKSEKIIEHV